MRNTNILYSTLYRFNNITPKNGRRPQKDPFPYLGPPLVLKDKVVDKSVKSSNRPCFNEMMSLLVCLKETDFNDKQCLEHQSKLKICEEKYLASVGLEADIRKKGSLTPGAKTLTSAQANILLKKYPQPRARY